MKRTNTFFLILLNLALVSPFSIAADKIKNISPPLILTGSVSTGKAVFYQSIAERHAKALAEGSFQVDVAFAPEASFTAEDYLNLLAKKMFEFKWVSENVFSPINFVGTLFLDFSRLSTKLSVRILESVLTEPLVLPNGSLLNLKVASLIISFPEASSEVREKMRETIEASVSTMFSNPVAMSRGNYIFIESLNPIGRDKFGAACEKIFDESSAGLINFNPNIKLTPK